jgi:hypothetical protein
MITLIRIMTLLGNILYIAGYTFDFENNVYHPPLDIEVGRQNTYVAKPRTQKKGSTKRLIFTTLYVIIIYILIMWLVVYSLYMAIRDKNIFTFGRSWFQILLALQHHYATTYFSDNHFYENIMSNEQLKKYMTYATPCLLVFSVMLGFLNVALLNKGFRYNGYDELFKHSSDTQKALLSLLIFLDSFYSYITFTINSCVFVINMLYHKITVSNYSDSLGAYIKNSMNVVRKLNIIATEFSQMKYMFNKTVQLLSPFFSVLNFIGFITIYFYLNAVQHNDLGVSEFINVILFVIVEYVYIQTIQSVNQNISNISETVTSNSIIATFFGNKRFNRTMPVVEHTNGNYMDNQKRASVDANLNIRRHDDSVKISTEDSSSESFERDNIMMRNKIESKNPIIEKNPITSIDRETHGGGLNSPHQNTNPQDELGEYYKYAENYPSHNISDAYLNTNNNIMKQIMIASISTEQMLDWLVLGNIVSSKWTTFTVFGVEFTDTTLISKLVGAGVGVLMTTQLGFILKWW